MLNTAHKIARDVVQVIAAHGINRAVLCPGSRNAPLCVAFEREGRIGTTVVVDERCAAFVALGMAVESGKPVAVVCTSGTAPLNMAPAIAEAYYRGIPLIAVTADRPPHMIDILDSQTIRQPGIFANFIKGTYDLADDTEARRLADDALRLACEGFRGPVHINVRIGEPIGAMAEVNDKEVLIDNTPGGLADSTPVAAISEIAASAGVLVVASCAGPDQRLSAALRRMAACGNVMVVQDAPSNTGLDPDESITAPDLFFASAPTVAPEFVITIGGAPVSGAMKKYLRGVGGLRHWSINQPGRPDTFGALERMVAVSPSSFFEKLASEAAGWGETEFRRQWRARWRAARRAADAYIARSPFTALSAVRDIIAALAPGTQLHLSNGMTVRYAQYAGYTAAARVDCNRGVSGIDGCTSTAIGAAMCTAEPVVLLSGDMSAQYDMGALALADIPSNFKMAVFSNGGGNIFRHIASTRALPEMDKCLAGDVRFPAKELAAAFGLTYFRADSSCELAVEAGMWLACSGPALLEVVTDGHTDAENYINLIDNVKKKLDNH